MISDHLSEREIEVLFCAAEDFTDEEIAEQLGLSISTIRNHMRRICTKLATRSRTGAVAKAVKKGYIQLNNQDNDII